MKNFLLCLAGVFLCHARPFCQYYFYDANHLEPEWRMESGISIGSMNCLTDLGGHEGNGKKFLKDVNWKSSKACAGIYFSITHHDIIGIRIEFTRGSVAASDSLLKSKAYPASLRYYRNLHFKSTIMEWNAILELHPLFIVQERSPVVSPYLLLGFGYFQFQPEAFIEGHWARLQPLHTEGQGFKEYPKRMEYKLRQANVPLGIGAKYDISNVLVLRMEFEYRILFTDYLDDVSKRYIDPTLFYKYFTPPQADLAHRLADRSGEINSSHQTTPGSIRGNPKNKDAYYSINLKFGIVLNRKKI
jgi:hypothetical protein